MIKLRPIVEMQLIKEALPLSKAREFASIERNPGIEKHLNLIFEKLKSEPGAKVLNELGRVAIPVEAQTGYYNPIGHMGNNRWDEDFEHSEQLNDFAEFLWDAERGINYVIRRYPNKIDSSYTPINNAMLSFYNIITGKNLKDQYGREIKLAKFIPYLITTYYKLLNIANGTENPTKVETDEQLKNTIKEKINQLLADYNNIPEVKLRMQTPVASNTKFYIVFSKHSYDIAGMSTDRGWTSCMNIYSGSNKRYIQYDIKEGTIVAYLIKEPDFNINNPTARLAIKPYVNIENPDDVYFQPETKVYGTPALDLQSVVTKLFDKIQPGKSGTFALVDTLYCDSGVKNIEK